MSFLANARDIASAAPGLRPGQCLRSDAPMVGDEPPPGLKWPPATVYDLRDPSESEGPHGLDGVANVHHVQVFADAAIGELIAKAGAVTLADMYGTLISSPQATVLVGVVRGIATDATPVLVHCSAGKDRAGVTAALVLALVGAPREAIVADYVTTAQNMGGVMARFMSAMPVEMRAQMEAAASAGALPDAVSMELLDAPAAAIEGVLDAWDAWEGGVEGWYLAHGGDAQTLGALRSRLGSAP